jgi:hypothetical protein
MTAKKLDYGVIKHEVIYEHESEIRHKTIYGGMDDYLEPYLNGKQTFETKISDLKRKVSDNPLQVQKLEEIHRIQKSWLEKIAADEPGEQDRGKNCQKRPRIAGRKDSRFSGN